MHTETHTETETPSATAIHLTLSKEHYFTFKALFNAAGTDPTRVVLAVIFYDHRAGLFVVTDGHICRFHKPDPDMSDIFQGDRPAFDFALRRVDFLLTAAQWKARGDREVVIKCSQAEPNSYLQWRNVIQGTSKTGHPVFGLDPEAVERFSKSFYPPCKSLIFVPGPAPVSGLHVFRMGEYVGIIMPLRVIAGGVPRLEGINEIAGRDVV